MKIEDLEKKIENRANAAVQEKVAKFKSEVADALHRLFNTPKGIGGDNFGGYWQVEGKSDERTQMLRDKLAVLKLAICDTTPNEQYKDRRDPLHWPTVLWQNERNRIRDELLSQMDLMQRLLMTADRKSDGDVPEATTPQQGTDTE